MAVISERSLNKFIDYIVCKHNNRVGTRHFIFHLLHLFSTIIYVLKTWPVHYHAAIVTRNLSFFGKLGMNVCNIIY